MDKIDQARIIAAHNSWEIWGKLMGWTLIGSTYEQHATFCKDGHVFEVSSAMRDSIDEAMHNSYLKGIANGQTMTFSM